MNLHYVVIVHKKAVCEVDINVESVGRFALLSQIYCHTCPFKIKLKLRNLYTLTTRNL